MAAHQFWALQFLCRQAASPYRVAVAEIEFRATVGGSDLCSGGSTNSTGADAGFPAANAFDDNDTTDWSGSDTSEFQRILYNFGAPVTVAEAWLKLPASGATYPGSTHGPLVVLVQGSDDGSTWRNYFAAMTSALGDSATLAMDLSTSVTRVASSQARQSLGAPSAPAMWRVSGLRLRYDSADGGIYRVAGTTAIDGSPVTPVRRRVRLYHRLTGRLVREAWSAPVTGAFEFAGLANAEYVVLTDDFERFYNAVVADAVTPVL